MDEKRKWKAAHTEGDRKNKSINNQLHRTMNNASEMWKERFDETEKQ